MNPHVKRTSDDIDRGVKLKNTNAVDGLQKNIFDKEHLVKELISLEKDFEKLKY